MYIESHRCRLVDVAALDSIQVLYKRGEEREIYLDCWQINTRVDSRCGSVYVLESCSFPSRYSAAPLPFSLSLFFFLLLLLLLFSFLYSSSFVFFFFIYWFLLDRIRERSKRSAHLVNHCCASLAAQSTAICSLFSQATQRRYNRCRASI